MRSSRLRRAALPAVLLTGTALFATSLHGMVDLDDQLEVAAAVQKKQHRTYDAYDCDRRDKPAHGDRVRSSDDERRKLRNKL